MRTHPNKIAVDRRRNGRPPKATEARSARRLDMRLLEDANGRLSSSMKQPPAVLGMMRLELEKLSSFVAETRFELTARQLPKPAADAAGGEANALAQSEASSPVMRMLQMAESIHELTWTLHEDELDPKSCEAIARNASMLYAVSRQQAMESERALRFADALVDTTNRLSILSTRCCTNCSRMRTRPRPRRSTMRSCPSQRLQPTMPTPPSSSPSAPPAEFDATCEYCAAVASTPAAFALCIQPIRQIVALRPGDDGAEARGIDVAARQHPRNHYPNEGNSVDLAFPFRHFDRRICIGADWPEYNPRQVRERFDEFAGDFPDDKRYNIAYRNLYHFLGLDDEFSPLHPVTDLY